jgi:hypothetical protein
MVTINFRYTHYVPVNLRRFRFSRYGSQLRPGIAVIEGIHYTLDICYCFNTVFLHDEASGEAELDKLTIELGGTDRGELVLCPTVLELILLLGGAELERDQRLWSIPGRIKELTPVSVRMDEPTRIIVGGLVPAPRKTAP